MRRAVKGTLARFRAQSPQTVLPKAQWSFGKLEAILAEVNRNMVTLDRPAAAQMTRTTVNNEQLQQTHSVADPVQQPSETIAQELLEDMPHTQPFNAVLSVHELQLVTKELPL